MNKPIVALSMLALCLTACSDAEYSDSDGGAIAIENLDSEWASAYCTVLRDCVTSGEAKLIALMVTTSGSCEERFEELLDDADLQQAVDAGLVVYDAAKARECLDQIVATCRLGEDVGPCEETLVGTLTEGQHCADSLHCAPGLWCSDAGQDRCEWTCEPLPTEGESCGESAECADADGLEGHCDWDTEVCQLRERLESVPKGGACGGNEDGFGSVCESGLWCNEGVCSEPIAVGASCEHSRALCAGSAFCIQGECRPVVIVNEEGGACGDTQDALRLCNEFESLFCDDDQCVRAVELGAGEPCADAQGPCPDDLFCDYTLETPVCSGPKEDGGSCAWDVECLSDYCTEDGMCAAPPACEG